MKIFLTSAGFDNKKILQHFVHESKSNKENSKILFVPTAAITDGAKKMLPLCKKEILEAGILEKNIVEVEISEIDSLKNLNEFCAIYVAGGDTRHLVNEMNQYNFRKTLSAYLLDGGIYFGVSAGSIALTNSFEGCLNYINCRLNVHRATGTQSGKIDPRVFLEINLTDNQALILRNEEAEIVE